MEKVSFGKVVKIHGIAGGMKVATKYDKDFDIQKVDFVFDENDNKFKVNRIFQTNDGVVVILDGVDINKARTFIGRYFYIDRNLVADKILIEDLKNSVAIFDDGEVFGKITDVQDYGSAEVFYLKDENGKEFMFPNVVGLIKSFDYKEKSLVIDKQKLKEVCDYENWYFNTFSRNVCTNKRKYFKAWDREWKTWNKYN